MVNKDSNESNISQGNNILIIHVSVIYSLIYSLISLRIIAVTPNDLKGKIITEDGVIIFDKVPIITPNNDLLVSIILFMLLLICFLC
jgi:hypothetical protein